MSIHLCPACASGMEPFFDLRQVPAGSSVILQDREEALAFPTGDIVLGFCRECGFMANVAFDADAAEKAALHEDTQAYSATFSRYLHAMGEALVQRHDLHGKRILEVGCGQGEFLSLLCRLGPNEGIGFDPVIDESRVAVGDVSPVRAVRSLYDERVPALDCDLVCCKMTLEHISAVAPFVRNLKRALRPRQDSAVFVQVPESLRILRTCAFEDVYYEHCSYFTPGALARLFRAQGLDVDRIEVSGRGQYLAIEGRQGGTATPIQLAPEEESVASVAALVADFPARYAERTSQWRDLMESRLEEGPVALWGSGSKATSFMTSLGLGSRVEHIVDINPYRQGRYVACTGQRIMAPEELAAIEPRSVVVMNANYKDEVAARLASLGIETELLAL